MSGGTCRTSAVCGIKILEIGTRDTVSADKLLKPCVAHIVAGLSANARAGAQLKQLPVPWPLALQSGEAVVAVLASA